MPWLFLADLVLVIHFVFVLFVLFGAFLALYRPRFAFFHIPAVIWGTFVEIMGWICPLTPLENRLRRLGGESPYHGDFIERYLLPVLYPEALTRKTQIVLGLIAISVNLAIYGFLIFRRQRAGR